MELPYQRHEILEIGTYLRESVAGCPIHLILFLGRYYDLAVSRIIGIQFDQADAVERTQDTQFLIGLLVDFGRYEIPVIGPRGIRSCLKKRFPNRSQT